MRDSANRIPWRERPALRVHEIAELLGVSRSTAQRAVEKFGLQANRRLGVVLYPISEVLRLLRELELDEDPKPIRPRFTRAQREEARRFIEGR